MPPVVTQGHLAKGLTTEPSHSSKLNSETETDYTEITDVFAESLGLKIGTCPSRRNNSGDDKGHEELTPSKSGPYRCPPHFYLYADYAAEGSMSSRLHAARPNAWLAHPPDLGCGSEDQEYTHTFNASDSKRDIIPAREKMVLRNVQCRHDMQKVRQKNQTSELNGLRTLQPTCGRERIAASCRVGAATSCFILYVYQRLRLLVDVFVCHRLSEIAPNAPENSLQAKTKKK